MSMTTMEDTLTGRSAASLASARRRLPVALVGNALMRVARGASGVLVGLYLADLANRGAQLGAALVGTMGAVSFTAELLLAIPAGMLSDAIAPRALMTGGAILGALATQLFGSGRCPAASGAHHGRHRGGCPVARSRDELLRAVVAGGARVRRSGCRPNCGRLGAPAHSRL